MDKCIFGFHKYEVYKEELLMDLRGNIIGKVIINRCVNCGKIKTYNVFMVKPSQY